jgi:hypothetical protein
MRACETAPKGLRRQYRARNTENLYSTEQEGRKGMGVGRRKSRRGYKTRKETNEQMRERERERET